MPLYVYECKKCHKIFEMLVGVGSGDEEIKCPDCGSKDVEKRLGAPCRVGVKDSGSSSSSSGSSCPLCSDGTCKI